MADERFQIGSNPCKKRRVIFCACAGLNESIAENDHVRGNDIGTSQNCELHKAPEIRLLCFTLELVPQHERERRIMCLVVVVPLTNLILQNFQRHGAACERIDHDHALHSIFNHGDVHLVVARQVDHVPVVGRTEGIKTRGIVIPRPEKSAFEQVITNLPVSGLGKNGDSGLREPFATAVHQTHANPTVEDEVEIVVPQ